MEPRRARFQGATVRPPPREKEGQHAGRSAVNMRPWGAISYRLLVTYNSVAKSDELLVHRLLMSAVWAPRWAGPVSTGASRRPMTMIARKQIHLIDATPLLLHDQSSAIRASALSPPPPMARDAPGRRREKASLDSWTVCGQGGLTSGVGG